IRDKLVTGVQTCALPICFQPYITMEVYDRLRNAFREYRHMKTAGQDATQAEQNAIFYAGWLGHYVADGSQPLHVSVSYDGWVGRSEERRVGKAGRERRAG